jgi:hypothetical protein
MNALILIGVGILGVVAYMLVRAVTLQQDAEAGNVAFSFNIFIKKDILSICLSLVAVLIWVYLFQETFVKYTALEGYTRLSFAGVGFMGSYILQLIFGKAKKYVRNEIDAKTNELDELKKNN